MRLRWWPTHILLLIAEAILPSQATQWTTEAKLQKREQVRKLWNHGFQAYMDYAFPTDELMPLSCWGTGPDWINPLNIGLNDVAGNFSLTLIDVLDTIPLINGKESFAAAVRATIQWVQFDVDTKPQVFETNIRVLGGLLSAHILASEEHLGFKIDWYQGELLTLAKDLGERLLPAFDTPTGLPYARINLRKGVPPGETAQTCTAGAGSLILEFATLSRLTGDIRFETAARKAYLALWNRRSSIGLVGNTINVVTGKWDYPEYSSVGAGIDSFLEYALKFSILTGDTEFGQIWEQLYKVIQRYIQSSDGYLLRTVGLSTGVQLTNNIDSLSAFWPGLQVLAGDVEGAIKTHLVYWNLWKKYRGIPEIFDTNTREVITSAYPLRPEFIESTYFLYQATRDSFYLDVGAQVLSDLQDRSKVDCGLASYDVLTGKKDDRMESFALSETLKYLYLLFDDDKTLRTNDSNIVFTTEAHLLYLNRTSLLSKTSVDTTSSKCTAHMSNLNEKLLVQSVRNGPNYHYAQSLVLQYDSWDLTGDASLYCRAPKPDIYTYDFLLAIDGGQVDEDINEESLRNKVFLWDLDDGRNILVQSLAGVRLFAKSRVDGRGYDLTQVGHLEVPSGGKIYINDTTIFVNKEDGSRGPRPTMIPIAIYVESLEDGLVSSTQTIQSLAYTSFFGSDPREIYFERKNHSNSSFDSWQIIFIPENPYGCDIFGEETPVKDAMVLVKRGECLFTTKLKHAQTANAAGILIWHDSPGGINPTADEDESLLGLSLVVPTKIGADILDIMELHASDKLEVRLRIEDSWDNVDGVVTEENQWPPNYKTRDTRGKMLYVNGFPMMNTVLLV